MVRFSKCGSRVTDTSRGPSNKKKIGFKIEDNVVRGLKLFNFVLRGSLIFKNYILGSTGLVCIVKLIFFRVQTKILSFFFFWEEFNPDGLVKPFKNRFYWSLFHFQE